MLKSYITQSDLEQTEPSIVDYLRVDETNYQDKIDAAFDEMSSILRGQNKKLRLLCTPLAVTDAYNEEDIIERNRVVFNVVSATNASLSLYGSNDKTTDTLIETYPITQAGTFTYKFSSLSKYYKVISTGTISFTAEIVETTFELPQKYLALSLIYNSKRAEAGDIWQDKYKEYSELFVNALGNAIASYDANEDNKIDTTDEVKRISQVRFGL